MTSAHQRFANLRREEIAPVVASAVGGTTGAIFGPWLASRLAGPLGTASLLLVAVAFLRLAVVAGVVAYLQPKRHVARAAAAGADTDEDDEERPPAVDERAVIGGSGWEGQLPRLPARRHPARPRDAVHRGEPRGQVQVEGLHRHLRLPRRRRSGRVDRGAPGPPRLRARRPRRPGRPRPGLGGARPLARPEPATHRPPPRAPWRTGVGGRIHVLLNRLRQ
jgi:hypothetical protein